LFSYILGLSHNVSQVVRKLADVEVTLASLLPSNPALDCSKSVDGFQVAQNGKDVYCDKGWVVRF